MVQNAEYRRNINKSNLILTVDKDFVSDKDSIEMFRYNKIPYFLCMWTVNKDLNEQFYYDITGMRSLDRLLEYKALDYTLLLNILNSFDQACVRAGDYMLTENDILLEPSFIFTESESAQLLYCYLPGSKNDICKQFQSFMEYLLQYVEHKDERAVQLAYGVYQHVANDMEALHSVLTKITTGKMRIDNIRIASEDKNEDANIHAQLEKTKQMKSIESQERFEVRTASPEQEKILNQDMPLSSERLWKQQYESNDVSLPSERLSNQDASLKTEELLNQDVSLTLKQEALYVKSERTEGFAPVQKESYSNKDKYMPQKTLFNQMPTESYYNEKTYVPQKAVCNQISTDQTAKEGKKEENKKSALFFKRHKKERVNKQMSGKLKNFFLKKIYTDNARYQEEEIIFEEEEKEESSISNPTMCLMPESDSIQNQFIYQGSDRARDFTCTKGKIILGSSIEECDICIHHPMISRVHARVEVNETGTFLEDMNSRNGTHVNGKLLQYRDRHLLQKGDIISLAGENYSFH